MMTDVFHDLYSPPISPDIGDNSCTGKGNFILVLGYNMSPDVRRLHILQTENFFGKVEYVIQFWGL